MHGSSLVLNGGRQSMSPSSALNGISSTVSQGERLRDHRIEKMSPNSSVRFSGASSNAGAREPEGRHAVLAEVGKLARANTAAANTADSAALGCPSVL